jgi:hypothetical protein
MGGLQLRRSHYNFHFPRLSKHKASGSINNWKDQLKFRYFSSALSGGIREKLPHLAFPAIYTFIISCKFHTTAASISILLLFILTFSKSTDFIALIRNKEAKARKQKELY